MLSEAFNDKADLQRMKDHNYAMAGRLEDVGRIATNANQEHRTGNFKEREDKKKNEAMMRLLRQQEAWFNKAKETGDRLDQTGRDINRYKAVGEELEGIKKIRATETLDDDRGFLQKKLDDGDPLLILYMQENGVKSIDDMTSAQVNEAMEEQQSELENEKEALKQNIMSDLEQSEKDIAALKKENPDWKNDPRAKEIIDGLDDKFNTHKQTAKELGIDVDQYLKTVNDEKHSADKEQGIQKEERGFEYLSYKHDIVMRVRENEIVRGAKYQKTASAAETYDPRGEFNHDSTKKLSNIFEKAATNETKIPESNVELSQNENNPGDTPKVAENNAFNMSF